MYRFTPTGFAVLAVAAVLMVTSKAQGPGPDMTVLRAPVDARLPQVAVDGTGTLHLVYYRDSTTDAARSRTSGDLFYVTRTLGASDWSAPRQVNSRSHSVTGFGPIDGGQIAIEPDGRLHVAWFHIDPMRFYYTRLDGAGGFEEKQTLSVKDEGNVESGPTVAARSDGSFVVVF